MISNTTALSRFKAAKLDNHYYSPCAEYRLSSGVHWLLVAMNEITAEWCLIAYDATDNYWKVTTMENANKARRQFLILCQSDLNESMTDTNDHFIIH